MNVTPDNWLDKARRDPIAGGSTMILRRILVIHATCGASGQSSIDYWKSKRDGIMAHVVIDRDGSVIQCRPFDRTCFHVRDVCKWQGWSRMNLQSIGFEIANAEDDPGALSWAKRQPGYRAFMHKGREFEAFPEAQVIAVIEAARAVVSRYDLDDIVTHASLDPSRRDDPGPAFPWDRLREACGFA